MVSNNPNKPWFVLLRVPPIWHATSPQPPPTPACCPCLLRRAADDGDEASCSEDEVLDEGMVGHRIHAKKQKQRVSGGAGPREWRDRQRSAWADIVCPQVWQAVVRVACREQQLCVR